MNHSSRVDELYQLLPLPIGSRYIRLLTVLAPTSDRDLIQGELKIVNLDTKPTFSTLSYVWGRSAGSKTISIGSAKLFVTDNCFSALWHLRRKFPEGFTIWIDSICIDQNSKDEKEEQVPLMGCIYSIADVTYIWLGEGSEATDRALFYLGTAGFLKHFLKDGNPEGEELPDPHVWAATWSLFASRWNIRTHPVPSIENKPNWTWQNPLLVKLRGSQQLQAVSYNDLDELLSTAWTTRIWTYQEIILASNPVLVCGITHLAWSRFQWSLLFISQIAEGKSIGRNERDSFEKLGSSTSQRLHPIFTTIQSWRKLVVIRDHIMASTAGPSPSSDLLAKRQRYLEFVGSIFIRYTNLWYAIWPVVLFVIIPLILTGPILVTANLQKKGARPCISEKCRDPDDLLCRIRCETKIHVPPWRIILAAFVSSAILIIPNLISWIFCRHAPLPSTRRFYERRGLGYDLDLDFVDGIYARNATEQRDMAFGLQSVLSKLLQTTLPKPDYSAPIDTIFRVLSEQLLQATNSPRILIPAALKNLNSQPSWVTDWSSKPPSYWVNPHLSIRDIMAGFTNLIAQRKPPTVTAGVLRINAWHVCTLKQCFEFRPSSISDNQSEKSSHLSNLRILFDLFQTKTEMGDITPELSDLIMNPLHHPNFPSDVSHRDLKSYRTFLMRVHEKDPITAQALLNRDPSLLRAHVAFCNSMVHTHRKAYSTKDLLIPTFRAPKNWKAYYDRNLIQNNMYRCLRRSEAGYLGSGICSSEAQPEDKVILVPGVPLLLVVRARPQSPLVQLVGPAIVMGSTKGLKFLVFDDKRYDFGRLPELQEFNVT